MALGQAHYPDMHCALAQLAGRVRNVVAFDAPGLAQQAGSPLALNMVILGALVRSGAVPLSRQLLEEAIRARTRASVLDVNLKAFRAGMQAFAKAFFSDFSDNTPGVMMVNKMEGGESHADQAK